MSTGKTPKATRLSVIGDIVSIRHRGQLTSGRVHWISPTRGTIEVRLADGTRAYEFTEQEPIYPPRQPRPEYVPSEQAVRAFKCIVNNAMEA